jgi:hypothetical protein
MAERKAGEPLNRFMQRFMGAKSARKPETKPRGVVGYAEARAAAKR